MGYLQININGRWGAICGCSFTSCLTYQQGPVAAVACRQLGLPTGNSMAFSGSSYIYPLGISGITPVSPAFTPGPGSSGQIPFLASMIQCFGNESNIQDCSFFPGIAAGDACTGSGGSGGTMSPAGADLGIACIASSPPPSPSPPQLPPLPPSPPSPPPMPPLPPYAGVYE